MKHCGLARLSLLKRNGEGMHIVHLTPSHPPNRSANGWKALGEKHMLESVGDAGAPTKREASSVSSSVTSRPSGPTWSSCPLSDTDRFNRTKGRHDALFPSRTATAPAECEYSSRRAPPEDSRAQTRSRAPFASPEKLKRRAAETWL